MVHRFATSGSDSWPTWFENPFVREAADKALDLAFFVLGDRRPALEVTASALWGWQDQVQRKRKKRGEYGPKGRFIEGSWMRPFRTKLTSNELQELQLLVYQKSATCEQAQEQPGETFRLTDEDFIVRYIKHLVMLTTDRSSFYVTLGLCRLLYDYTMRGVMDIYETVMQDIERQKGERYYGKQRLVLMKRINKRFAKKLQTHNPAGREMKFLKRVDSERCFAVVAEALEMFTPWQTYCPLPNSFRSVEDSIPNLTFRGPHPDREHPVEELRIHALLHLPCFEQLAAALRLAPPPQALSLPQFFNVGGGDRRSGSRHGGGLQADEWEHIKHVLQEAGQRRKNLAPDCLKLKVDGFERSRVSLNEAQPITLEVDDTDRLLEIVSEDEADEFSVGTLLLGPQRLPSAGTSDVYSVSLAKGRELLINVTTRADEEGEYAGADLTFKYREGAWNTIPARIGAPLSRLGRSLTWARRRQLVLASLLIAALVGLTLFFGYRYVQRPTNMIVEVETAQLSNPPDHVKPPNSAGSLGQQGITVAPPSSGTSRQTGRAPGKSAAPGNEGTRGLSPSSREALAAIKRIYVEAHPGNSADELVRSELMRQISASGKLRVVDEPREADGFLLWQARQTGSRTRLRITLTDTNQRILWSESRETSRQEGDSIAVLARSLLSKLRSTSEFRK